MLTLSETDNKESLYYTSTRFILDVNWAKIKEKRDDSAVPNVKFQSKRKEAKERT